MTTPNYAGMTTEQLMTRFLNAPADEKPKIIEAVKALTAVTTASTGHVVDVNASGGVYIKSGDASAIAKTSGNAYCPSANLELSMAVLLCAETDASRKLRSEVLALANLPKDEFAKRVAAKQEKKEERNAKTIASERSTIEKAVKAGRLPASALAEFDAKVAQPA